MKQNQRGERSFLNECFKELLLFLLPSFAGGISGIVLLMYGFVKKQSMHIVQSIEYFISEFQIYAIYNYNNYIYIIQFQFIGKWSLFIYYIIIYYFRCCWILSHHKMKSFYHLFQCAEYFLYLYLSLSFCLSLYVGLCLPLTHFHYNVFLTII